LKKRQKARSQTPNPSSFPSNGRFADKSISISSIHKFITLARGKAIA